jgi:DNA-binding NarL/FixJ family response regulator
VALVEDDRETRARLAASIRAQGSLRLVAEYATGAEALSGLESAAPEVLLVDLGLPDVSGLDVARFVAGRHPECDILIISIFGDEANVLAALEAGARGYLLKGSLQRDIALDIRDIRNGGSPLSPIIARQRLGGYVEVCSDLLDRQQRPQPVRRILGKRRENLPLPGIRAHLIPSSCKCL